LAAPLAVAAVLFDRDIVTHARVVLSDLPAATIALLQLALLVRASRSGGRVPILLAGLTAGYLPWLRPAMVLFVVAGVAALTARPEFRRNTLLYLLASAPLLALLGCGSGSSSGRR
jgi:hypothetical protein